ncbi:uncharacterized protein TNCV_4400931 [Trichonephila clavipes]|nr:uncharacterized protein TNCV_4400931 [Trichonephila clavipes]
MDHVILNHGQVTWTTPELAPPLLTTTPHQLEDVSALDRFSVHRCPTRRVRSGSIYSITNFDKFTYLSLVTFSPSQSMVTTDIPFTYTMSGVSYPKGDGQ